MSDYNGTSNEDFLGILSDRLLTLELNVDEMLATLVDKGLIDKDTYEKSMDEKIERLNKLTEESTESINHKPNDGMFNNPMGEA